MEFQVCFMCLINMTPLIASNAVFILIKLCGMGKFLRVKNKSLKPVAKVLFETCYIYKKRQSMRNCWFFVFVLILLRSYNLRDDSLVGEQGWTLLFYMRFYKYVLLFPNLPSEKFSKTFKCSLPLSVLQLGWQGWLRLVNVKIIVRIDANTSQKKITFVITITIFVNV